jgi:predicted benzoate:H+ symporter BenE
VLDQGSSITIDSILTPEIMAALAGLALLALAAIPLKRKFQNDTRGAARSAEYIGKAD